VLTWVAVDQALDTHQDTGTSHEFPEVVDPLAVFVGLLDTHAEL